ncbi:MAG TPA: AMP-binding protein, partial [Gemmatimonadaceae bacterium]|nr:AMP-binding protein [Gemmatimonadaceae bacterium]
MTGFLDRVAASAAGQRAGVDSYASLYAWSVAHPAEFWPEVWRFCDILADARPGGDAWDEVVRGPGRMAPPDAELGPRWFLGARLSFAENLLRRSDDATALVSWTEQGRGAALTFADLRRAVARIAVALRGSGVRSGDRVAAFMPNVPET